MRPFHFSAVALLCLVDSVATADQQVPVSFRSDIAPILRDRCLACHGPKKAEGGYRVDTYEQLLIAGDSGDTPVTASEDEVSELLRRVISDDEFERMPAEAEPLPPGEVDLIKKWISAGVAFDGEHIAQPLDLVIPPVQYAAPPETYTRAVPITASVFSPDGKLLVTSGYHELVVWNVVDGSLVRRIHNIGQRVFALAFSPNGETLAVGCGEPGRSGEVRLVDFHAGTVQAVVARTSDVVLDLAFRPQSNQLAIASADSTVRVIDVETSQELRTIASHADWVTAVAWSDDGALLASSSRDKSAKVYDGETGELRASYLGHGAIVRGVSILGDGKQVVSVGADKKLHRWNIDGAKKVAEIGIGTEGHKLSRSESNIYVPCSDMRLLRIDMTNNTVAQEFKGHNDWVLTACLPPNQSEAGSIAQIASGSFNGEVRIWNLPDGAIASTWIAKP